MSWKVFVLLAVCCGVSANNTTQDEGKVCYGRLGCFSLQSPWKTTLRPLPAPFAPKEISTKVYYYSRPDVDKRHFVTVSPEVSLGDIKFDAHKPTVLITHGFASNGNSSWMSDLKNAYLKNKDANVMIVDWGKGASLWNYFQVASNTRIVARQLEGLMSLLIEQHGLRVQDVHLIGHSLGAQISSYVAKSVKGIGRLTALDPAQPAFEGFDKAVRLDPSDAEFVDVVHTDARPLIPTLGFGMITPHGHVDFYLNGGFDQPGCIVPPKDKLPEIKSFFDLAKYPVEVIGEIVACPHGRSYEYFTEALNETECVFWGHKASAPAVVRTVANTLTQGVLSRYVALSSTCSKEDCTPLGLHTPQSALRGSYVVTTRGRSAFCVSEPGVPAESTSTSSKPSVLSNIPKIPKAITSPFS